MIIPGPMQFVLHQWRYTVQLLPSLGGIPSTYDGVYVASQYKNQLNDLQPMLDASAYDLFVLFPPIKDDVWR